MPDRVVAEDAEAPQRMRRRLPRMRIVQDIHAVAYTEVPLTFKVLRRQWRRWTIGVLQTLFEHREIFYRMDKYQAAHAAVVVRPVRQRGAAAVPAAVVHHAHLRANPGLARPDLPLPDHFHRLPCRADRDRDDHPAREDKPVLDVWYRFINDPLQIYLTAVCFWMILSGRMPTTRKIWSQVPRSGVVVGGTVARKIGVDAVQVPVAARTTAGSRWPKSLRSPRKSGSTKTTQVPEEEEWQRENAETKALPLLKLDDDTARARGEGSEGRAGAPNGTQQSNGAVPRSAASNGAVSNGAVSNGRCPMAASNGTASNGAEPDGAGGQPSRAG